MRQVNHHLATRDVVFLCGLILVSESFNGQVKWMDRGFQITSCWFVYDPKIDINEQIFNKTDNIWSQKTVHNSAWSQWRCSKGAGCVIMTHVAECDWIKVTAVWCCYKLVITSHGPRCLHPGDQARCDIGYYSHLVIYDPSTLAHCQYNNNWHVHKYLVTSDKLT